MLATVSLPRLRRPACSWAVVPNLITGRLVFAGVMKCYVPACPQVQAAQRYGTPQVLYTFRESHQVRNHPTQCSM